MSKAEQIKKLRNGNGIQYLLDEGYKILGNPLNVFDTDYNLIAHVDVSVDDRFWRELTTTGTFGMEAQTFFMNECFTDDVANAEKLALMTSDKLKYDRILGHIYNGNGVKVANALMIEYTQAFEPDLIAAFDALVGLLTREISCDTSYIAYGEKWQSDLIGKLIDGNLEEKRLYSPHLQNLYNGFKMNLYLAVVDIAKSPAAHKGQKHFVDVFRQKWNDFKYAIYGQYIVMIMSTDYKVLNAKRDLSDSEAYFERNNLCVGISGRFDNLFELKKHYAEAVEALSGAQRHSHRHVFVHKKRAK